MDLYSITCFHRCAFMSKLVTYKWLHGLTFIRLVTSHGQCFSPVCVLRCTINELLRANDLSHTPQGYGFSPVCVLRCVVKVLKPANDRSHTSHGYGFSPVCVLRCTVRYIFLENDRSHTSHWYGFSQVLRCTFNLMIFVKGLSHTSSGNCLMFILVL